MKTQDQRDVGSAPLEYETPRVETVLTGDDFAREVAYAGTISAG